MYYLKCISIPLILSFVVTACQPEEIQSGNPGDFRLEPGKFRYHVRGDLQIDEEGIPIFYRAGTSVVLYLGERDAPIRLELAYEESRENHTGQFRAKTGLNKNGFLMFYKFNEEEYWQQSGTIDILTSHTDTIIGRMDHVVLTFLSPDTLKEIEVTGSFKAY